MPKLIADSLSAAAKAFYFKDEEPSPLEDGHHPNTHDHGVSVPAGPSSQLPNPTLNTSHNATAHKYYMELSPTPTTPTPVTAPEEPQSPEYVMPDKDAEPLELPSKSASSVFYPAEVVSAVVQQIVPAVVTTATMATQTILSHLKSQSTQVPSPASAKSPEVKVTGEESLKESFADAPTTPLEHIATNLAARSPSRASSILSTYYQPGEDTIHEKPEPEQELETKVTSEPQTHIPAPVQEEKEEEEEEDEDDGDWRSRAMRKFYN